MSEPVELSARPRPPRGEGKPGSVVALFVRDDGSVLSVTRRDQPGNLSLVGGSIEDKDRRSPDDRDYQIAYRALVREVEEETGVIVKKAQWIYERVDETDGKIAWCYQVHEWEGEPRTVEPGVEVSWRRPEELLAEKCTFRDYNRRLFISLGWTIEMTVKVDPGKPKSDGSCDKREDGLHCVHWWDGDAPCCGCGFDGELDNG